MRFERLEGAKVHLFAIRRRFWAGALLASITSPARADELQVSVACPAWSSEAAAQVEARIRATFLAANLNARRAVVSCSGDSIDVEVEAPRGSLVRPVVRRSEALEDDVVATAETALHDLSDAPSATAEPEPSAPPAVPIEPPPPLPTPVRAEAPPAPVPVNDSPPANAVWRLHAGPVLELWSTDAALGGEAGVSARSGGLGVGLALGGRSDLGQHVTFTVTEWNASARLLLVPARLAGFRGSVGVGASLLVASPARGITADSSTQVSAAYVELRVSRPFSVGGVAFEPSVGARVFSARRDVQVNDQERLAVPLLVPQVALWLAFPGD